MNIGRIVGGIGVLIFTYLIVVNADKSAKIISTISTNATAGIKTLQGR